MFVSSAVTTTVHVWPESAVDAVATVALESVAITTMSVGSTDRTVPKGSSTLYIEGSLISSTANTPLTVTLVTVASLDPAATVTATS